jgi:2-polyprenyl-3-methyl-5-hydroxy-6-metoxy-1,4-benzoquinol methylase|tara:strand:- start:202 stop:933 length:732 start_codon:yes stop_codon:yes gene_type:complete
MSKITFDNYGKKAEQLDSYLEIASRHSMMDESEKLIIPDVIMKLALQPYDRILDIGCGAGNLLIPLSFFAKEITGIDHSSCIELLRTRIRKSQNILLLSGNFLDIVDKNNYDKILCYSVLQYLADEKEVFIFIKKALESLVPGGRALFADIPNTSKKERFLKSNYGKKVDSEYQSLLKDVQKSKEGVNLTEKDEDLVQFDDDLVLRILKETRGNGYHSYVLDQSTNLCLGYTREDILIVKPED